MVESKENLLSEINSFADVPTFNNEEQEAEFWANHSLGEKLLDRMEVMETPPSVEEAILDKLRQLPRNKQQEVLDFTEFLYQKAML